MAAPVAVTAHWPAVSVEISCPAPRPSLLSSRLSTSQFHLAFQISETEKVLETKCQNATIKVPQLHRKKRPKDDGIFWAAMTEVLSRPKPRQRVSCHARIPISSKPQPEMDFGDQNTTARTLRRCAFCANETAKRELCLNASFPGFHRPSRLLSLQLGLLQSRGLLYSSVPPTKSFAARLETIRRETCRRSGYSFLE